MSSESLKKGAGRSAISLEVIRDLLGLPQDARVYYVGTHALGQDGTGPMVVEVHVTHENLPTWNGGQPEYSFLLPQVVKPEFTAEERAVPTFKSWGNGHTDR